MYNVHSNIVATYVLTSMTKNQYKDRRIISTILNLWVYNKNIAAIQSLTSMQFENLYPNRDLLSAIFKKIKRLCVHWLLLF